MTGERRKHRGCSRNSTVLRKSRIELSNSIYFTSSP
jgi:hypothetical protein